MNHPTKTSMVNAIADATKNAFQSLCRERKEKFYYVTLITTGEGHAPFLSAWSEEAFERADSDLDIRWSYSDSPYAGYGATFFADVRQLFLKRPSMDYMGPEKDWLDELHFRLDTMEDAMIELDRNGLFGRGVQRNKIIIAVELMPPDSSNSDRVCRLNPASELLNQWLREAGE